MGRQGFKVTFPGRSSPNPRRIKVGKRKSTTSLNLLGTRTEEVSFSLAIRSVRSRLVKPWMNQGNSEETLSIFAGAGVGGEVTSEWLEEKNLCAHPTSLSPRMGPTEQRADVGASAFRGQVCVQVPEARLQPAGRWFPVQFLARGSTGRTPSPAHLSSDRSAGEGSQRVLFCVGFSEGTKAPHLCVCPRQGFNT